ncbi:endonuclease/exonuclease/phosphatase family protein [Neolewinella antarctica]|uniref:Endonuclease/exonuclease/phosphatase (EEP) superfamily protein YafD n=1 Tax=Neolewinella antarctica TaxID=442734 RepID=A0ABX0XFH7_9BACT|nr:endonuclease/exonuclease/phosphatase family protein [Neolewinella antarctica]NJC27991.1 endonuclease/exonuclease/phosphatase (EEP) superfamily protein YafD [Neolewinella antarctica]
MLRTLFHLLGVGLTVITACGLLARFVSPAVLWPPAVIALLLPGLLALTLIYLLIVVFLKDWKLAILPVLVMVVAIPLMPQLYAFNFSIPVVSANAATITVLTANVRHFKNDAHKGVGVEKGIAFIGEVRPSVLLLQEAWRGGGAKYFSDPVKEASGLSVRHQPGTVALVTFGNELEFVDDHMENNVNGVLVSDVMTEFGKVRIINAHLQSNRITELVGEIGDDKDIEREVNRAGSMFRSYGSAAARRARQAIYIREQIDKSPYPVILGGDFNDVPSSYAYRKALSPRLRDAWVEAGSGIGTTFTGPLPALRIDFLLVDTAFTVRRIERVETGYSDHRGLVVELGKR